MTVLEFIGFLIVVHVFMVGVNAVPSKNKTKDWTAVSVLSMFALVEIFCAFVVVLGAKPSHGMLPDNIDWILFGFGAIDAIVAVALHHHRNKSLSHS
jgi:hypothetical protein